jgi:hypothetical protein
VYVYVCCVLLNGKLIWSLFAFVRIGRREDKLLIGVRNGLNVASAVRN